MSNVKSASLRLSFMVIYGMKEQVMVIGGEVIRGLCMHSVLMAFHGSCFWNRVVSACCEFLVF